MKAVTVVDRGRRSTPNQLASGNQEVRDVDRAHDITSPTSQRRKNSEPRWEVVFRLDGDLLEALGSWCCKPRLSECQGVHANLGQRKPTLTYHHIPHAEGRYIPRPD